MAMTKDGDKKPNDKKSDVDKDASSTGSIFNDQKKKDMFDIPPTGGVFDSPESEESVSPFDVEVDVFHPDENDIDEAVDGVFTSANTDSSGEPPETGSLGGSTIGRRKETSILFSLGNLQSLANDPDDVEGVDITVEATSPEGKGEMSGLIDIRTLKDAFVEEKEDHVDDLLSVGSEAFSPVLTFQARGLSKKAKLAIIGASAALVIALIIIFVFALSGDDEDNGVNEKIAALQAEIEELRSSGSGSTAQVAALEAKLAKAKELEALEEEVEAEDEDKKDVKSFDRKKDATPKNYKLKSKDAPENKGDESDEPEESDEPKEKKVNSELDDLLSGSGSSSSSKKKKSGSSSKSSGATKASLDRSDVQRGLGKVAGKVKACGHGTGGFVTLKIVIGSNGKVLTAQPTGAHSGTSVGTCSAKAVKSARFPKTKSSTTVSYPFKL